MIASKKHIHTRWCDFPGVCRFSEKYFYFKSASNFLFTKISQKKLMMVLFSPSLRKLFQSFPFCGIVCTSFDIKILRPEISLDLCVISFIWLSSYVSIIICLDSGSKDSWGVTDFWYVSANSIQIDFIGITRTSAILSYIQSASVGTSFLLDLDLLIK